MQNHNERVTVVIPARFGSSRFPGKPLAKLSGKSLIQHVYEGAAGAHGVGDVVVATDDLQILQEVKGFGGMGLLIDEPCRTGTDRVAMAAAYLKGNIFLNIQGDEILLHPDLLNDLIVPFLQSQVPIGTLKRRFKQAQDTHDPSVIKVVTDQKGVALYFSRSSIPYYRDVSPTATEARCLYMHLGVYIFRREALLRFSQFPTGALEEQEKLEQLRALEHGLPIYVWETTHSSIRVDTPEDLLEAEKAWNQIGTCSKL